MALPWLSLVDIALDITNLALGRAPRRRGPDRDVSTGVDRPAGQLDTQLAGVVVAALKEAFDRDASRLAREREQMERERERAERALTLELLRQAGEREIGRLRLVTGVAFASVVGTLFFLPRVGGGHLSSRVTLGAGWLLLLAALALSFAAQSRVSRAMARVEEPATYPDDLATGAILPWLVVAGLGAICFALLRL
jgi:hypothetical protein